MQKVWVIFKKQLRDTLKNKMILIQFVMFPVMTIIMEKCIDIKDMPENFFVKLFAVMYIGMAPLVSTAAIISEEKEKDTLRVLMMANVKPWQYLTGVGLYVWTLCMAGAGVMSVTLPSTDRLFFMAVMAVGIALSIVAGACIGIYSRNQMMATSLQMPVMLVFSFAPMLAVFNDIIKKIAIFFYTQQLKTIFDEMSWSALETKNILILCANAMIFVVLLAVLYRKKGLE